MQNIVVVSIKDRLANVYSQPMFFATEGHAIRAFQDALHDSSSNMSKHPEDYDLFILGHFNDELGQFKNLHSPRELVTGKQVMLTKGD